MKYYHGSSKLFEIIKENSWVTPYKEDALIFAIPWSSKDLEDSGTDDGRPPKKLKFKDNKNIPPDHPIYLYEITGPVKPAKTNTGKKYDWNFQTKEKLPAKLIKEIKSWHNMFLSNAKKNELKKLPKKSLLRLINKAKNSVKSSDAWKDICNEYDLDVSIIDYIPVTFEDLDVTAKTNKGIILLNYQLLEDFEKNYSYLIHEAKHWVDQCFRSKPTKGSNDGNYLDNQFEQKAFQHQIDYISDEFGKEEAEDYVDDLLDHHDVTSKKEIKDKKEILMSKV